ncbi:hypothetical protein [Haliangium sp. UPWRP_2]|uniref:hypothetical protein n=1 Tax=Haliangium sp. UPWRP_2 TaxID=1931276 RepID=UPI000D0DDCE0|nr:hypothetical protein [Haliangium sp. UPWRP_2]PSM30465.1 hypothetical protein BVG81_010405 [Haliangium sp. UPWRP_2]
MAFWTVENPVVQGSSPTSVGPIADWDPARTYAQGDIVVFNGSQYMALGVPPVAVVPALEAEIPVLAGAPKWRLIARGRTRAAPWEPVKTYYADQVVTYLGGTYVLDAPTVPPGALPAGSKAWTRLSETLTDAESAPITLADFTGIGFGITIQIQQNIDETPRVRRHIVTLTLANFVNGQAYFLRFPRPMLGNSRPEIIVLPQDGPSFAVNSHAVPIAFGPQIIGYQFNFVGSMPAGTYVFEITVKQMIAEVT